MKWLIFLAGFLSLSATCLAENELAAFSVALSKTQLIQPATSLAFHELTEINRDDAESLSRFWFYKNRAKNLSVIEELEKRLRTEDSYDGRAQDLQTLLYIFPSFLFEHRREVEETIKERLKYWKDNPELVEAARKVKEKRDREFEELKRQ